MAFTPKNLITVAGQAKTSVGQMLYYLDLTDGQDAVLTAGFFNSYREYVNRGDIIQVTDVTTSVNFLYIIRVSSKPISGNIEVELVGFSTSALAPVDYIDFNTAVTLSVSEGRLIWNADDGTLNLGMPGGSVNLQIGQEILLRATNTEGSQLVNGTPVYVSGATGANIEIQKADASEQDNNRKTLAVVTEDIDDNQKGYATTFGFVRDVDTSGCNEGDEIFVAVGGGFTSTRPALPNGVVRVGYCVRSHATEGVIFVNIASKSVKDILVDTGDLTIKTASGYTVVLEQPVYKDINVGGVSLRAGASNQPTLVNLNTTTILVLSFASNQINEVSGAVELQHDYKEGEDIVPHVHWYPETTDTGVVRWGLEYYIVEDGTVLGNGTIYSEQSASGTAWDEQRADFSAIDGSSFTIGSQVHFRFFRDGTHVNDTFTGNSSIGTFGIHYPIDTIGSRQITSK